ncbi:MAG: 50S ribosomal protein L21 [Bacilli bacterium]|nr:50S ribosomal protein L21 [Bacilli bacterium]MDD4077689.1 50S ribosomal protein L21 [Bacilli bacterium]MDD4388318.1 50S ribosomal protein L21 [Bacilli bacterium]
MYAIFETGGKQYRVSENDVLYVEKLDAALGDEVVFEKVFLVGNKIGTPYVRGAKVIATVEKHGKNKKIVIFKYKPKKNYHKKQGHRQPYTKLKIIKIEG